MFEIHQPSFNFRLGVRDENYPSHWRECSDDFSFKNKKTILVLPGSATNSAKDANGMCKIVQNLLPDNCKDNLQICSLYYENSKILPAITVLRAQSVFDNYIIPLIASKDDNGDLHRISAIEAGANLRNLIVFSHCYGGFIQNEMDKLLDRTLDDLGYLADEKKFIHKQLFVVHHNNIDEQLGEEQVASTRLYRIISRDEECGRQDVDVVSFLNYAIVHSPEEKEALYIKLSDNERVLLVDKVAIGCLNQHNGAYWGEKGLKTDGALKEDMFFSALFQEVVSSNYRIENLEQVLKNAVNKNPALMNDVSEVMNKGMKFGKDYYQYRSELKNSYLKLKSLVQSEKNSAENLETLNDNVLFVQDKKGNFLFDYAIEGKNYSICSLLWNKMKNKMLERTKYGYRYVPQNVNQINALEKLPKWIQAVVNDDEDKLFADIVKKYNDLTNIDFNEAGEKCLQIVADEITKAPTPKTMVEQKAFYEMMVNVYARCENLNDVQTKRHVQNVIENKIFATSNGYPLVSNYGQEVIKESLNKLSLDKLLSKVEANWPAKNVTLYSTKIDMVR